MINRLNYFVFFFNQNCDMLNKGGSRHKYCCARWWDLLSL